MSALLENVDPEGLREFSVVFTDRSLNSMSKAFQKVMTDISEMLKDVYKADSVALVPGGGTYAMEAVARQVARDQRALVVRNGWFSYRWSPIMEAGGLPDWRRGGPHPRRKTRRGVRAACGNLCRGDLAG